MESKIVIEAKRCKTSNPINKKVYFFGFKAIHLMIFATSILFILLISIFMFTGYFRFLLAPLLAAPVIYIMGIVAKENKRGVPDYIASMLLFFSCKKKVEDNNEVFRLLSKNKTVTE